MFDKRAHLNDRFVEVSFQNMNKFIKTFFVLYKTFGSQKAKRIHSEVEQNKKQN